MTSQLSREVLSATPAVDEKTICASCSGSESDENHRKFPPTGKTRPLLPAGPRRQVRLEQLRHETNLNVQFAETSAFAPL